MLIFMFINTIYYDAWWLMCSQQSIIEMGVGRKQKESVSILHCIRKKAPCLMGTNILISNTNIPTLRMHMAPWQHHCTWNLSSFILIRVHQTTMAIMDFPIGLFLGAQHHYFSLYVNKLTFWITQLCLWVDVSLSGNCGFCMPRRSQTPRDSGQD